MRNRRLMMAKMALGKVTTLAKVVARGQDGHAYNIVSDIALVKVRVYNNPNTTGNRDLKIAECYITDGQGNWARLDLATNQAFASMLERGTRASFSGASLSQKELTFNRVNGNPVLSYHTYNNFLKADPAPTYTIREFDLDKFSDDEYMGSFNLKPCEIVRVTGEFENEYPIDTRHMSEFPSGVTSLYCAVVSDENGAYWLMPTIKQ